MSTPNKPEFTWEKEEVVEKDAYAIHEKGVEDSAPIKKLLKRTSLRDIVLLSEILTRPYQ